MAVPMAMASQILLFFLLSFPSLSSAFSFSIRNRTAIELPGFGFNSVTAAAAASSSDCGGSFAQIEEKKKPNLKLQLNHHRHRHRHLPHPNSTAADSLLLAAHKDHARITQTLSRKAIINKTDAPSSISTSGSENQSADLDAVGRVMATINSGVPLGSGEYFINAFVGTPPVHFQLILDTGSDLNWIQCLPCHDCFDQHGPFFDPSASSSYRNVPCADSRCSLVSSPDTAPPCAGGDQPCPYFYWYGDRSNTTGDLALETFTVNLTSPDGKSAESHRVDEVIFGCGHWNRGLFHGAAGLLGLGRGPLSFASQLKTAYGHTFSYCLVDRNSDLSVSSKLIFGEDPSLANHPNLNYTSFVGGQDNAVDTFYYVQVKGIRVGGEMLGIPSDTWELSKDGAGGTIVDSGTTLSYLADPAYEAVRKAFVERVKYPPVANFPVLSPCYNVSGVEKVEMPEFSIVFGDGAVWDFPTENYFIKLEPEEIMCLAILGTPRSSLSIIGNYQQQNFHVLYDTEKSRLGFAPMRCADI